MNGTQSPQHLGSFLSHLTQHWEKRHAAETAARGRSESPPPPLTIALERQAGAWGTSIAREVGARLNWPVYDHELLEQIAQDMGVRATLLKSVDERRKTWALETAETFMALPAVSETAYVRHLIETVLVLGAHGECVIVGRGSPFILPPATTLRVRLVANVPDRIMRVRQLQNLSPKDAERETARLDQERTRFAETHFLKNLNEPENYDLVLNTSRFSAEECAGNIIHALQQMQARWGKGEGSSAR
jgi:cytidylate kinase